MAEDKRNRRIAVVQEKKKEESGKMTKQDKKNKFPDNLLEEWDNTCKEIRENSEKVRKAKEVKTFDTMTNMEIAEYIAEQLCIHSARRRDTKINVIHKSIIDLKKGVRI